MGQSSELEREIKQKTGGASAAKEESRGANVNVSPAW